MTPPPGEALSADQLRKVAEWLPDSSIREGWWVHDDGYDHYLMIGRSGFDSGSVVAPDWIVIGAVYEAFVRDGIHHPELSFGVTNGSYKHRFLLPTSEKTLREDGFVHYLCAAHGLGATPLSAALACAVAYLEGA